MTTTSPVPIQHEPQLLGQTVVLVGGSAGIGLETARLARREGAEVVLVGRDPERLKRAALDVDARSTAAFDATDPAALEGFFTGLPGPIDHVLITAGGPAYGPMLEASGFGTEAGRIRKAFAEGDREAMIGAVSDEMLDAIGVAGTAEQVAAGITRRADDFNHVALYSPSFTMTLERVQQNTLELIRVGAPAEAQAVTR